MRVDHDPSPLRSDRLLLRRSVPEDAEIISAYRSLPEVHRYQGWERTDVAGVRAEIVEMLERQPGAAGWVQFSVLDAETGELVGDLGASPVDGEPGVLKIGYTIAPPHQGKGFATEAVGTLIDYAFDVLEVDVVRMHASAENVASIRVAEKVGMHLVERWERRSGGRVWHGVRYERRSDAAG